MGDVVVFDTETTGLLLHPGAPLEKQPRCIDFGAAVLDRETGEVKATASFLIKPPFPISDEIVRITGITNEMLDAEAVHFEEVAAMISGIIESASLVIAHNLPFDKRIVSMEFERICRSIHFPAGLCTVAHHHAVWGRNPKLIELYEWSVGRPLKQQHRALADVNALVEIVQQERLWSYA